MTEEEVAQLDLELGLELDNVNADNIDWAIYYCTTHLTTLIGLIRQSQIGIYLE